MRTLVIEGSGYLGRTIVGELKIHGEVLAIHHSRKTDLAPIRFTFPGAHFDDLMRITHPDLVIFAA